MGKTMTPDGYLMILLGLSIASHFLFPIAILIPIPYNMSGILFIISGFAMALWTNSILIKGGTSIMPFEVPSHLVSSGPFKLSRNPVYLGMAMILLGTDILLGSLISLVFPMIFILIIDKAIIPSEERELEKRFGDRYLEYKRRTRRWI